MLILIRESDFFIMIAVVALLCILMYAAGVQMGRRHPQKDQNLPQENL